MSAMYILDAEGQPRPENDPAVWGAWMQTANCKVALTHLENADISTVFLGLDYAFGGGPPLLWETMIFGGRHDDYQVRYSTLADAKLGHAEAVALARP